MESQSFEKEEQSALLPAVQRRNVLSMVKKKVTHELGDSCFEGEMGTAVAVKLRRDWR